MACNVISELSVKFHATSLLFRLALLLQWPLVQEICGRNDFTMKPLKELSLFLPSTLLETNLFQAMMLQRGDSGGDGGDEGSDGHGGSSSRGSKGRDSKATMVDGVHFKNFQW